MITPDPLEMYGVGIGIVSQTAAVVWCSSRVSLRVISRRVARCALSFQAPYSTESTPLPRARPPHREEQVRPSEPSRERQQWGVLPEGCEGIVGTTMTVLGALLRALRRLFWLLVLTKLVFCSLFRFCQDFLVDI